MAAVTVALIVLIHLLLRLNSRAENVSDVNGGLGENALQKHLEDEQPMTTKYNWPENKQPSLLKKYNLGVTSVGENSTIQMRNEQRGAVHSFRNPLTVQTLSKNGQSKNSIKTVNVLSQLNQNEQSNNENLMTSSNDSGKCVLNISSRTSGEFRHIVFYNSLTYVYLHLKEGPNVHIVGNKYIVGETHWVWTFSGKEGSIEFLNWPMEFGIWSMNLLSEYVYDTFNLTLNHQSGNCTNLLVGNEQDDRIIAEALVQLPRELMVMSEEMREVYGPSFFCYKKRIFLNPTPLYDFCKYIVCPAENIKHQCCTFFYNNTIQDRRITCSMFRNFDYDDLWWIWPIIFAVILFSFFPLLLMRVVCYCMSDNKDEDDLSEMARLLPNLANEVRQADNIVKGRHQKYIFLDNSFPVTLGHTLLMPFGYLGSSFSNVSKRRITRALLPIFSLSIIVIQIVLDHFYLRGFIGSAVSKGVLLGFRSMLAGYSESRHNFLPSLGGPYVALSVYLLLAIPLITVPRSLSRVLSNGLVPMNTQNRNSLMSSLALVEKFGSVQIHGLSGFDRIYNFLLGQFFMLLNKRFWCHIIDIQKRRWSEMCHSCIKVIFCPFYVLFCICEILICVLAYNGIPIVSFTVIIVRAYLIAITRGSLNSGGSRFKTIKMAFVSLVLIVVVIFQIFMACTIFLDACVFITRVFMFTYTGIVVYPKVSYGYLIFFITVLYYVWHCVQHFANNYAVLLRCTIKVCASMRKDNARMRLVITSKGIKGLRSDVFENVIEDICPRRKQVFCSFLKLTIILTVIGMSLGLLRKTDKFRELHTVMHVGTALFTCALPQILGSMCKGPSDRVMQKLFQRKIRYSVREFLGYFEDDDNSVAIDAE